MRKTILLRSAAVVLTGLMSLVAVGSPAQAAPTRIPLASLLPSAPVAQADRQAPNPSAVPAVSAAAWGYWLRNDATNLCLDGSASRGVRWATCNSSSLYQQWNVSEYGDIFNYYYCLDGAVANGVRAVDCNGGAWQTWYGVGENVHNYAYYEARSLDGSVSQGIRMNTTNYNSAYQHWYFQTI